MMKYVVVVCQKMTMWVSSPHTTPNQSFPPKIAWKKIFLFVKRAVVGGSIYISIIREFESQSDSPPPEGWMGRRSTQVAIHGKR